MRRQSHGAKVAASWAGHVYIINDQSQRTSVRLGCRTYHRVILEPPPNAWNGL